MPQPPKIKILSLTAGTYYTHSNLNNGCVELTLEVDGFICTLNDADLSPEAAQAVCNWLAERLNYTPPEKS